ncbi:D-alanyl-D-alanine carboxypeptidase family protein [Chromohalobacter sp. HP20-39]|uniref:D-alanyl-D-alanine carboxypeptidase family protein n=1 Tax=Chromohalobacter sp. HP20-39 TaxID=3079306 RepID=UPI00294AB6C0|nr:D-alanyl-D-alanine carboxypeptidase family protein [Chromohalobacter sp. HP20-39]MDV6319902.1 D-alanyl-D-alanine carboxypeptidase family protein [Chromohalobacter sp. HP20-39]
MRVFARSLLLYVVLLVTLCVGGLLPTVQAKSLPQPSPVPSSMVPSPPQLSATAWVLMDANSGKILVEHNADKELPPASLTKMMTAYIVEREIDAGNISGDEKATISEHAWRTGGSRMFLKPGSKVTINDLLHGVVIQSGNDASVALAEHIAGSEGAFADLMNQQAARMNLKHTHFMNPTGLPHDDHYSSAHDLAVIAQHIIKDYPDHYEMYSEKYFTWNDIRQPNRNRLLWRDPNVDGLKTGHTEAAGYCLVASAKEDGTRLIAVVMGTDSDEARAQETQKLLSYGFRFFETQKLYKSGAVLNKPRVWGGEQDTLRLGVASDVFITVPRGRIDELNAQLDIRKTINAPVEQGEQLGTLKIKLDGEVLDERPLVALEPVPEGGFFKRLWDSVLQFVYGFFD